MPMEIMNVIEMLYFDRIDVSKGVGVNRKRNFFFTFYFLFFFYFFIFSFFSPLMYNHTTSSQLYYKYYKIYKGYMLSMPNQQKQLN